MLRYVLSGSAQVRDPGMKVEGDPMDDSITPIGPATESRRSFLRKAGFTIVGITGTAALPEFLAACSSSPTKKVATPSAPSSIALISPQSSGGDPPVLDMIAAMDSAGKAHSAKTRFVYVSDPSRYTSTLNLAADSYDIVVTAFPEMGTPIAAAAKTHPKTRFIWIYGSPLSPSMPNVVSVGYKFYEGMYFAGILAASISTTHKIGYIGGAALPTLNADYWAYAAGARTVDPSIIVSGAFVGSFTDPTGGLQIADSMYGSGVDVIQTDASASDDGVLEAAKTRHLYMSWDTDLTAYKQAPGLILGAAALQFGTSLALQLESALQPKWTDGGTFVEQGLKDKVTGYVPSPEFATSASSAAAARFTAGMSKVHTAEAAVASGTLTIPYDTKAIP